MKSLALVIALAASVGAFLPASAPLRGALMRRSVAFADPVVADGPIEDLPGYSSDAAASGGEFLDMGELDDMEVDPSSFGPARPYVNQQALIAATEKWRRHSTDVGSPEYQIAVAHERIKYLTAHLQNAPKDFASRRGLVAIVNKRRRLLNYLFKENPTTCMTMVAELGVRFKPPGSVVSRAEKYAVFNQQSKKSKKGKK